jgi:iron complex transport system substrate-binding protein
MAALFILLSHFVQAKPQKIVSINLCTDQLLMLLAERENIASVSYLAAKPNASAMFKEAAGILVNHGQAEEILLMKPDLILAGTFTSRPAVFLLKRLGFNIVELPVASDFDDIRRNIMTVAHAVGEIQKGEQLIASFNNRLLTALATHSHKRPVAVFYRENGYTTGGNALANTILEAGGFINLAVRLGISGSGHLSLETLISQDPDIIISGRRRSQKGSAATAAFQHPAFKQFKAQKQMIVISDPFWICGTPFVLDAVEHLVAVRQHGSSHELSTE